MTLPTSTLRPGLLVALKTSVDGNVRYQKTDIERTAKRAHWETVREVDDPAEHEKATQLRGRVRSLVRSACAKTAFGFLCPEDRTEQLNVVLAEATKLVAEFNASAKSTSVWFGVMVGKVAATDLQAVRAINSEVRDLLSEMARGVAGSDADAVRDAAVRAKQVAQMLAGEAQALVEEAVEAARKAATAVTKAKKDKTAEVDQLADVAAATALTVLTVKRQSFLDFDEGEAVTVTAVPAQAHKLDLDGASNAL